MTLIATAKNWWDTEASADTRYATLRWGGDGTEETVEPTMAAIIDNLSTIIDAYTPTVVTELGCGPGRLLHRLARKYPNIQFVGVDISPAMVALGDADRPDNVTTMITEGASIPDHDTQMVYSVETFQHLAAGTKQDYLTDMARLLPEGGVAVVQYVEGVDDEVFVHHPETAANMKKWAKTAGLAVSKRKLTPVHAEWVWMVMTR